MRWLLAGVGVGAAIAAFLAVDFLRPGALITNSGPDQTEIGRKRLAERIRLTEARSADARGVYMTSDVANDRGRAATRLRDDIIALLDQTELDAVVIDVKETRGGAIITDQTKELLRTLHGKNVWVIARVAVFKDSSQEKIHPDWYLKWKDGKIWRDNRGGSWLDPAAPEVWAYQLAVAKAASDAGFDEIQFDYIRFPSDGNVAAAVYPIFQPGQPKWGVLRAFFTYLHARLKEYRPELILSADLFGYVALQSADLGIGQRLEDVGENFDYVSL
ncbi:MAG: putative glycoside hydrolase, partial [bacterium]|nr:putative glycoside hydrolase [bacterium]